MAGESATDRADGSYHDDGERVGHDADRQGRAGPTSSPSSQTRLPGREVELHRLDPSLADAGVGHVGARSGSRARAFHRSPSDEIGIEELEPAVVGMRPGRHVPGAEELGVHGRHDPTPPPGAPGDEVGDEEVQRPVDEDLAEVDRQRLGLVAVEAGLVTRGAAGAGQVAAEQARAPGPAHRPAGPR